MIRWSLLLFLFVALPAAAQPQPVAQPALPIVRVIATGGTIAGVQDAPGTLGGYRAGTKSVGEIVQSVPELARFAEIETEQFSNVASTEIMPSQWLGLAKRINELLARPDLAGVVVTHGTDRLEETAFFLYLTVKSDKPVVVVGAQRPATGISPDGPINLLAAVRTAGSTRSRGMGVMVVMDDRIISARENRKLYPRTGGFSGGEMGVLGIMGGGGPEFFFKPLRKHGVETEFDVTSLTALPKVELVFSYPGGEGPRLGDGTEGLVAATTGFSPSERDAFTEIRRKGVVIVQAFPSGEHVAGGNAGPPVARPAPGPQADSPFAGQNQNLPPMVVVQHLLPQKARILLMLALTRTKDPREIQRIFNEYRSRHGERLDRHRPARRGCRRDCGGRGRLRAVAPRLERATVSTTFLLIVLLVAATSRLWVAVVTSVVGDAGLQLLLPAAGRHLHDRRSAELGRAVRVPGRQPGRQQPVGGGARADGGSAGPPGRAGAPLRPEPRRAGRSPTAAMRSRRWRDRSPAASIWTTSPSPCRARPSGSCSKPGRVSITMDARQLSRRSRPRRPRSSSTPASAPMPAIARSRSTGARSGWCRCASAPSPIGLLAAAGRPDRTRHARRAGGVVAIAIERAPFLEERKAAELTRQSEELKTALLASLGHDLRTPLTAIRVAASNLQAPSLTSDERREQSDLILAEAERLTRLFQNILEMARIDAGAVATEAALGASVGDRRRRARPGRARAASVTG